ncbi:MAG: radical SAM protein [Myxococcales bacterium]|nr:radical SAM protein [Myxococcales bacterium]
MTSPRTVRQDELDQPRPIYAVWEITLRCDHACAHCGSRAGPAAREDELDTAELLEVADGLVRLGTREVTLIGGEAYLRNDFILVIRAIREAGMRASITTGGLHLTRKRAEAMVEAGVELVSVSIDGDASAHDRLRGTPGGFQRALEALGHVRRAGGRIAANTQINRLSHGTLLPLGERLAAEGIVAWQLFLTVPHGNAGDALDLVLQPHQLPAVYDELQGVLDLCDRHLIRFWPGNSLGYFGPLEHRLRAVLPEGHYPGCQAGRAAMGIESNGAIKSCPTLGGPANTGGHWREHDLEAIWTRAPQMRYVERRTLDDLWGYCRECYYAAACMAGCTAMGEAVLGRPGNNPYCHHRALELQRVGQRERIELLEPASGEPFGLARFRLIREWSDPERRAREPPIVVESSRLPSSRPQRGTLEP